MDHLELANASLFVWSNFSPENDTFMMPTPFRPLDFDRANEGQPLSSTCIIFKLPIEILSNIIIHLDVADLATLALLDRDCRQLARSAQFATIYLSISVHAGQLLGQLMEETIRRLEGNAGRHYTIGACVRRLVIATNKNQIEAFSPLVSPAEDFGRMYTTMMSSLVRCLPVALPNLEFLQLADPVPISPAVLRGFTQIRLRHLALDFLILSPSQSGAYDLVESLQDEDTWSSMKTLHIRLPSSLNNPVTGVSESRALTLVVLQCILRNTSPSVEELMLGGLRILDSSDVKLLPRFPRLRSLFLMGHRKKEEDGSLFLRALLPIDDDNTCKLPLQDLQVDRIDSTHLIRIGYLPGLRRLVVEDVSLIERTPNLTFLAANPQLELLAFTFPIRSHTVIHIFLPLLHSSGFSSLTTLRLILASKRIPRRAIAAIGFLSSLEMLWLSAGKQFGSEYDWFIKHDELREGLKRLQKLRDIAFSRDSYSKEYYGNFAQHIANSMYYSQKLLPSDPNDEILTFEDNRRLHDPAIAENVWEKWHRNRTLCMAETYVALFPQLEFFYAGQYPMKVVCNSSGSAHVRKVALLSEERTAYLGPLNEKWGFQAMTRGII